VRFTIGIGACDEDVRGVAHEEDGIVVLGGTVVRDPRPCAAVLLERPVSVTLDRPLGSRAPVDVRTGRVVQTRPTVTG